MYVVYSTFWIRHLISASLSHFPFFLLLIRADAVNRQLNVKRTNTRACCRSIEYTFAEFVDCKISKLIGSSWICARMTVRLPVRLDIRNEIEQIWKASNERWAVAHEKCNFKHLSLVEHNLKCENLCKTGRKQRTKREEEEGRRERRMASANEWRTNHRNS